MNTSKKYLHNLSKSLYKRSLTNGDLDDKKIKTIVTKLITEKPAKLTTILKTYKRLVAQKLALEEIIIETSDRITLPKNFELELKKKTGAKRIINIVNKNVVFGAKITHGDWVFEDTLESKLKQLTNNI